MIFKGSRGWPLTRCMPHLHFLQRLHPQRWNSVNIHAKHWDGQGTNIFPTAEDLWVKSIFSVAARDGCHVIPGRTCDLPPCHLHVARCRPLHWWRHTHVHLWPYMVATPSTMVRVVLSSGRWGLRSSSRSTACRSLLVGEDRKCKPHLFVIEDGVVVFLVAGDTCVVRSCCPKSRSVFKQWLCNGTSPFIVPAFSVLLWPRDIFKRHQRFEPNMVEQYL